MSTWDELVPSESKYLAKDDVGEAGKVLTIAGFAHADIGQGADTERKAIINWKEDIKPMVLNKTNAERLKYIFKSDDPSTVIGSVVNVYNDPMVEFAGKLVGGLRIRPAGTAQDQSRAPLQGNQQPTPPVEAYAGEDFDDSSIPF